jgi:hypothetical protein
MTDTEVMNFDDFRQAVGKEYSEYAIRRALSWLHLTPITRGRRVFYRGEWVQMVREHIDRGGE